MLEYSGSNEASSLAHRLLDIHTIVDFFLRSRSARCMNGGHDELRADVIGVDIQISVFNSVAA